MQQATVLSFSDPHKPAESELHSSVHRANLEFIDFFRSHYVERDLSHVLLGSVVDYSRDGSALPIRARVVSRMMGRRGGHEGLMLELLDTYSGPYSWGHEDRGHITYDRGTILPSRLMDNELPNLPVSIENGR